MFPDEPNVRNYKTKEQSVVDFVKIFMEKNMTLHLIKQFKMLF